MKANAKTRREVMAVLHGMWKAYAARNPEKVLSCYAPDPDVLVLGSGPDERYLGSRQALRGLRRDFAQSESARVGLSGVRVSAAGTAAWMAACRFHARVAGQDVKLLGRLTAVLEKRRGRWLIMQTHVSMPYGDQAVGQSFLGQ